MSQAKSVLSSVGSRAAAAWGRVRVAEGTRSASSGPAKRDLQKSFPIFSNRGGVIECNKSFVSVEYSEEHQRTGPSASNSSQSPSKKPHTLAAHYPAPAATAHGFGAQGRSRPARGAAQGSSWTALTPETPLLAEELKGWVPLEMRSRTQQAFGKVVEGNTRCSIHKAKPSETLNYKRPITNLNTPAVHLESQILNTTG